MKKIILFVLTCTIFQFSFAQEKLDFEIKTLPNHSYKNVQKVGMEISIKLGGSQEMIEELIKEGIDTNTVHKEEQTTITLMETFAEENGYINFRMIVESSTDENLQVGTLIYGKYEGTKMKIDSVPNLKVGDLNDQVFALVEQMMNYVKFTKKLLSIGDTMIQRFLVPLPIPELEEKMEILMTYKLNKIENGVGYFDQIIEINAKAENSDIPLEIKGNGAGLAIYDPKVSTFTVNNSVIDYIMNLNHQGMEMKMVMKQISEQSIEVQKANN